MIVAIYLQTYICGTRLGAHCFKAPISPNEKDSLQGKYKWYTTLNTAESLKQRQTLHLGFLIWRFVNHLAPPPLGSIVPGVLYTFFNAPG